MGPHAGRREDAGDKPRGPAPLGPTLQRILRQTGVSRGPTHRVYEAWNEAVGAALAAHAIPVGFQRGRLRVQVDSSARLQELRGFTGERHRTEANRRLGEPLIRKIDFKLGGR